MIDDRKRLFVFGTLPSALNHTSICYAGVSSFEINTHLLAGKYARMPCCAYFSAFCFASLRMRSATWRSRSSSLTVLDTDAPIDALTRFETTEDSVDLDMVVDGDTGRVAGDS